jgi:LysM repeat protein
MKRDARIGLAVVLVLGLMVTLLVGRAIYNSGGDDYADMNGTLPALEGAAPVTPAPSAMDPVNPYAPVPVPAPASGSSSLTPSQPIPLGLADDPSASLHRFVEDNTRPLGNTPVAPLRSATDNRAPVIEETALPTPRPGFNPSIGGDRTLPPVVDDGLLDHENPLPVTNANSLPEDGFGYTVQPGDNIWKISTRVYGDGKFTQKIVDANKDVNVMKLKPGMVVKIPVLANKTLLMKLPTYADARSGRSAPSDARAGSGPVVAARGVSANVDRFNLNDVTAATPAGASTTHTVQSGETLSAIAHKYYGSSGPKSVGRILDANKGLDPARLQVGKELIVPAK